MTMSVTYTTFAGMIVHENRGGEERFYSADTLGSTQALYDETGTVTDTFEYWPYGEIRTRTGTTPTPFAFVGVLGYFMDTLARLYVRARHYLTQQGRWLTVDPLWPVESAYGYVEAQPHKLVDPSGLDENVGNQIIKAILERFPALKNLLKRLAPFGPLLALFQDCYNSASSKGFTCETLIDCLGDALASFLTGLLMIIVNQVGVSLLVAGNPVLAGLVYFGGAYLASRIANLLADDLKDQFKAALCKECSETSGAGSPVPINSLSPGQIIRLA